MNHTTQLDSGEKLSLGNQDGHTQISLSSDEGGHNQAQSSAFPTGEWSQKPELFQIGAGYVAQLSTNDGQKWISIDKNGIHLLDKSPDLNDAKSLEMEESKAPASEPMKPMAPMKPMEPMKAMDS